MPEDYFNQFLSFLYHTSDEDVLTRYRNIVTQEIKEGNRLEDLSDFLEELLRQKLEINNLLFGAITVHFNRREELVYFDVYQYIEILSESYDIYIGAMALNLENVSPNSFNLGVSLLINDTILESRRLQDLQDQEKMLLELLDLYMFKEPDATEMCTKLHDYIEARRLARLGRKETN
jgi:hypothetical protein